MGEQRAFANQEREFHSRRLTRLGRALLMLIASVLSLMAVALLGADQLYHPETFQVDQLKIAGQFRYLDPADVEEAVIDKAQGNFFSLDLQSIKADVQALAWVESVDVRREWPDTLVISIVEHRPAMRWGKQKWLSTAGAIIELPESIEAKDVVSLSGSDSQAQRILQQAANWQKALAKQGLELRAVELSDSEAWTLRLYSPVHNAEFDLLLGHEEVPQRLERFELIFNKQFKFSEHPLKRVDARYPDGLAVEHAQLEVSDLEALPIRSAIALNK